jgi:hypothetical protein
MNPVYYNRLLARSIYLWGIFTPLDVMIYFGVLIGVLELSSYTLFFIWLVAYPIYLASFRLGRPPGNDMHLFRSYAAPLVMRPSINVKRAWVCKP